jgi:hypothetical protein
MTLTQTVCIILLTLLMYAFSLAMVESKVEGVNTDEDPSSWRPYITFTDCLTEKAQKATANAADGKMLALMALLFISSFLDFEVLLTFNRR